MRPFKFRAWKLRKPFTMDEYFNCMSYFEPFDSCLDNDYIYCTASGPEGYIDEQTIIMQFTGLLDKNGKEIYEGDLLKWQNQDNKLWFNFVVLFGFYSNKWSDESGYGYFVVEACYMNNVHVYSKEVRGIHAHSELKDYEVIGNIYENPELCSKA